MRIVRRRRMEGWHPMPHRCHLALVLLSSALLCLAGGSPALVSSITAKVQTCLFNKLMGAYASCKANDAAGMPIEIRLAVTAVLSSCLLVADSKPQVAMNLMPNLGPISVALAQQAALYSNVTGRGRVAFNSSISNLGEFAAIMNAQFRQQAAEPAAWWILADVFGDGVAAGALMDLTSLMESAQDFDWMDYPQNIRQYGSMYNNRIVGIPWSGGGLTMYIRDDVFQRNYWTVPETWDELAELARTPSGIDGVYSVCLPRCESFYSTLYETMISSYLQTKGPEQGFFFDIDTLQQTIVNNSASEEVLTILKDLYNHSHGELTQCRIGDFPFLAGECALTLQAGQQFKLNSHPLSALAQAVKGKVATYRLPGSPRVLDFKTGRLELCTAQRCPLATPGRSSQLINRVNYMLIEAASINQHADSDSQQQIFKFLTYLFSSKVFKPFWLDPQVPMSCALRLSFFQESDWLAAGYDPHDTPSFLQTSRDMITDPNIAFGLRIPGGNDVNVVIEMMVIRACFGNSSGQEPSPSGASSAIQSAMSDCAGTINGMIEEHRGLTMLRNIYLPSLNYVPVSPPPSPTPVPHTAKPGTPEPGGPPLAAVIAGPIGAALLLGLAAALAWRSWALRNHPHDGAYSKAPGPGLDTCLVVTDIQDSTHLWETLPASAMEAAVHLNESCLRSLTMRHGGYESATEGDSFIIAFPHTVQAVRFCLEAQEALLQLPWPQEVLQAHGCQEVWALRGQGAAGTASSELPSPDAKQAALGQQAPLQATAARAAVPGSTWAHFMAVWQPSLIAPSPQTKAALVLRGLRVRMGMHCGVKAESISVNKTSGRTVYSGDFKECAKAVSDGACGGQVTLSEACQQRLLSSKEPHPARLLHLGQAADLCPGLPPMHLYLAYSKALLPRLGLLPRPAAKITFLQAGVLDAPHAVIKRKPAAVLVPTLPLPDYPNEVARRAISAPKLKSASVRLGKMFQPSEKLGRLATMAKVSLLLSPPSPPGPSSGLSGVPQSSNMSAGQLSRSAAGDMLARDMAASWDMMAIASLQVVGRATLKEWDAEVYQQALTLLHDEVSRQLQLAEGLSSAYLLENKDGRATILFGPASDPAGALQPCSARAIAWAEACLDACKGLPWPEKLVHHELCEELKVEQYQPQERSTPPRPSALQPKAVSRSTSSTSGSASATTVNSAPVRGGSRLKHLLSKLTGRTPSQSPLSAAAAARSLGPSQDSAAANVSAAADRQDSGTPQVEPPAAKTSLQPGGQQGSTQVAPCGTVTSEITPLADLVAPAVLDMLGGTPEGLEGTKAQEPDGSTNDTVIFRGLRLKGTILAGTLHLPVDPATGHLTLGKKVSQALQSLIAKACLGQVLLHQHP